MELISLNVTTLFFFSLLPALPFVLEQRLKFIPNTLRRWNFVATVLCLLLAVFVFIGAASEDVVGIEGHRMKILHLIPLVITVLYTSARARASASSSTSQQGFMKGFAPTKPRVERMSWDQLVIDESLKKELKSIVELLKDPATARKYGINLPKGILLSGPPGTGKTTIAKVIANQAKLSFFVLQLDEIISKWVGDSEKNLSMLFEAAARHVPAVIFVDEVDSIGRARSGEAAWADNLLNHLLQLIDGVIKREGIYIIAATNRPDLVDPALKRSGRLNRVIEIPLPNEEARCKLFQLYLSRLKLEEEFNLELLSKLGEGFSGADIEAVCNQAGLNAFKRETGEKKRDYRVNQEDMKAALKAFFPS